MESNQTEASRLTQNNADSELGWYRQLSTADAAKLVGLSTRKLEMLRRDGGGPRFLRISRRCVRYRLIDLIEWQNSLLRHNNCDLRDESGSGSAEGIVR